MTDKNSLQAADELKAWLDGDELKQWIDGGSDYVQRTAAAYLRDIPADSTHESAIEARHYAELAHKFGLSEKGAMYIVRATAHWKDWMLWDAAIAHDKFSGGRPKGAVGPVAKKIRAFLVKHPDAKPEQVWEALKKSPPRGHVFMDSARLGRYIERGAETIMGWSRFRNLVSEHRPK